ncbi:hypothetical protein QBC41DRAFT_119107 [Cercophora samala]|uniref:Secreted protein n=1 Tax=Cercophora samala TaxID=330535 RepID=A0AA40D9V6_9PEZI|nr:hypothetical protein QBC41DRAFT_119107 [Cercophora samala]
MISSTTLSHSYLWVLLGSWLEKGSSEPTQPVETQQTFKIWGSAALHASHAGMYFRPERKFHITAVAQLWLIDDLVLNVCVLDRGKDRRATQAESQMVALKRWRSSGRKNVKCRVLTSHRREAQTLGKGVYLRPHWSRTAGQSPICVTEGTSAAAHPDRLAHVFFLSVPTMRLFRLAMSSHMAKPSRVKKEFEKRPKKKSAPNTSRPLTLDVISTKGRNTKRQCPSCSLNV